MSTDFRTVGRELSNWGRWGADDELGTLNLITPAHVAAAAALARTGRVFDLGYTLSSSGPQIGLGGRVNPVHLMSMTGQSAYPDGGGFADDFIFMPLQCATQWDGLAHVFYDGFCYNNVPASSITARGADRLAIDRLARGVIGRGVLVDVARLRGVDCLTPDHGIGPDELDAALDRQGVTLEPGSILLVRTGWTRKFTEGSAAAFMGAEPGLTLECCRWLREHDVAALAADNWAVERYPSGDPNAIMPVHYVLIRDLGMTLGEMFDLEALAADCAADGVYEFLLCAPVLKVANGVGTPLNPLAVK
ncbi:cyclase family protein [Frankia sp. CNm7]|uniref:Cyclase family protein n=1 Tax=Frankia nepalensis TaxID=1836974 RepID=A0A937RHN7_9ACTN|nr:cyclase family protein [Frankia nepalensis]MBL7502047.1 cyclase family protein [Frankia nepalensis]MBL7511953.1 cyclase family protein [Frankia nepalensis]MBL7524274.1 cyclase family protein [Frankia nepalensis]MBL7630545.1 cyclase family protein [Frankia nepalensis]